MSDITLIDDSEQSSLVTNGLVKNGELYLKKAGSTSAGAIVAYDNGVWRTFANEAGPSSLANTYSLNFDGANDELYTNYTQVAGSAISVSFWMNVSDTTSRISFLRYGTSTADLGLDLLSSNGLAFNCRYKNAAGTAANFDLGSSNSQLQVRDGDWHHIALTISGTSVKLYFDGGDSAISSSSPSNTQGTPFASHTANIAYDGAPQGSSGSDFFLFGRFWRTGINPFPGLLDELAFFESELSGSDVSAVYNSGVPADLTSYSPAAWYRMEEGTGTSVVNTANSGTYDATLINGPAFSSDVPS